MDRDTLYFHFANLGLVLIGLFSIQAIFSPLVTMILVFGTVIGFLVSWQMRDTRLQHKDTFIGMLSLAALLIIIGRLSEVTITFENLLRIFSIALAWLMLFQSFGLKTGQSYAMLQFISMCLLISSVGIALEGETFYAVLLALFLFIFIFTMRLSLVCEKKHKGSVIIGDREEIMSLWQQIKVGALMFSFVLIVASFLYPFVPRFENLSLKNIPSTLLGIPEQIPLLKLLKQAPRTIKENKDAKDQLVDDEIRKRETSPGHVREDQLKEKQKDEQEDEQKEKQEVSKRFRAKEFNKNIDTFGVESLTVTSDKEEMPLDEECKLTAEVKLKDGSIIPATRLVDWKVKGATEVSIDSEGNLKAKEEGRVSVSATYLGNFSNDIEIKITEPVGPIEEKSWAYYLLLILSWIVSSFVLCLVVYIFMRSKKLSELAVKNPREFIKEVYNALCRGFKIYGIPKANHAAYREFSASVGGLISTRPEPMRLITERLLEARFSTHKISAEDSRHALGLFHEIKEVVLEREEKKEFWKKILFRFFLLDVIMVSGLSEA
ncbi:Ig domain-containing protein [Candidatus Omnitrophota bacterium]